MALRQIQPTVLMNEVDDRLRRQQASLRAAGRTQGILEIVGQPRKNNGPCDAEESTQLHRAVSLEARMGDGDKQMPGIVPKRNPLVAEVRNRISQEDDPRGLKQSETDSHSAEGLQLDSERQITTNSPAKSKVMVSPYEQTGVNQQAQSVSQGFAHKSLAANLSGTFGRQEHAESPSSSIMKSSTKSDDLSTAPVDKSAVVQDILAAAGFKSSRSGKASRSSSTDTKPVLSATMATEESRQDGGQGPTVTPARTWLAPDRKAKATTTNQQERGHGAPETQIVGTQTSLEPAADVSVGLNFPLMQPRQDHIASPLKRLWDTLPIAVRGKGSSGETKMKSVEETARRPTPEMLILCPDPLTFPYRPPSQSGSLSKTSDQQQSDQPRGAFWRCCVSERSSNVDLPGETARSLTHSDGAGLRSGQEQEPRQGVDRSKVAHHPLVPPAQTWCGPSQFGAIPFLGRPYGAVYTGATGPFMTSVDDSGSDSNTQSDLDSPDNEHGDISLPGVGMSSPSKPPEILQGKKNSAANSSSSSLESSAMLIWKDGEGHESYQKITSVRKSLVGGQFQNRSSFFHCEKNGSGAKRKPSVTFGPSSSRIIPSRPETIAYHFAPSNRLTNLASTPTPSPLRPFRQPLSSSASPATSGQLVVPVSHRPRIDPLTLSRTMKSQSEMPGRRLASTAGFNSIRIPQAPQYPRIPLAASMPPNLGASPSTGVYARPPIPSTAAKPPRSACIGELADALILSQTTHQKPAVEIKYVAPRSVLYQPGEFLRRPVFRDPKDDRQLSPWFDRSSKGATTGIEPMIIPRPTQQLEGWYGGYRVPFRGFRATQGRG